MKSVLPLTLITFALVRQVSTAYCTTGCTYTYVPASPGYILGCNTASNSDCIACDTVFFDPSPNPSTGGPCVPLADSIYNYSFVIPQNQWIRDYDPANSKDWYTVDTVNSWLQFRTNTHYTQLEQITAPHYGFRCRVLLSLTTNFNPSLRFRVNSSFSEDIELVPVTDNLYNFNQWIYTSSFIPYRDTMVRFMVERTDSGLPAGQGVAFRDVMCFVAYCVPNCLSCTSLNDCSDCATGFVLNRITRYCQATSCPAGQFGTSGICSLCNPLCDTCTAAGDNNCINCTDSGPYEAFLQGTTCYQTCPGIYLPNYLNHKCQCPTEGYSKFQNSTGICVACPSFCQQCDVLGVCTLCKISYFMRNDSTACLSQCPAGQYANLIYDIAKCYLCDPLACKQCVNSSTMCTSCNFGIPGTFRYLYDYSCLSLCPDGYEGNNVTFKCDLCPLGMYSFENVCYSECPTFYQANDNIRACVVPGGYPINMTVSVQNSQTLRFNIPLPLGLHATTQTLLVTSWQTFITLTFITETSNNLIMNQRRALATSLTQTMTITNAVISNSEIILYSKTISAQMLIYTHTFMVTFDDNLLSPKNVIYAIRTSTSTDDNPWVVQQYFDLNIQPYYLIGIFLAVFCLLVILMRTKYVYRILIEYIHCIQLLGLTYYAIYPHSVHVHLYSFLMGLDFSNFSFLYNVPAKFIYPCYDCISLISFNFAIGDMNWLRMMGSLILCLAAMLIFCAVTYIFKCSRTYAPFFLGLVIDLVIIKTIHGWFASLLYSGLNYDYNQSDLDMYVLGTHMLSYFLLFPICYSRIKAQRQNNYVNFSFLFLIIFIILLTLVSIAPTLICALLIMTTAVEWVLIYAFNITEQQKPAILTLRAMQAQQIKQEIDEEKPWILSYHHHLLRCIKPLTAFLVCCIIMVNDHTIPIALISSILGVLLIMIMVDAYYLYDYYDKSAKIEAKIPQKSHEVMNDTKQDLKHQKQTQYRDNNYNNNVPKDVRIFEYEDMDDDVVANKFRKQKSNNQGSAMGQNGANNRNGDFFKNVQ